MTTRGWFLLFALLALARLDPAPMASFVERAVSLAFSDGCLTGLSFLVVTSEMATIYTHTPHGAPPCQATSRPLVASPIVPTIKAARGVALREDVGRERREAEQVVAAIHDHVDGEIVSRIDRKVRALRVSQFQTLPFGFSMK